MNSLPRGAVAGQNERDATVSADAQGTERHRHARPGKPRTPFRRLWMTLAAGLGAAVIAAIFVVPGTRNAPPSGSASPREGTLALPATPSSYIGLYPAGVPISYAGVTGFTVATGVNPRVVLYYSGWLEPFQTGFALTVAEHGAVPLVQMNPVGVSLAAIAAGRYDGYLDSFAEAIRSYGRQVILGFGHEMNGYWYSWGYQHTPPAVFVAAWRHIVSLFRGLGARNVTWLWTVNTIHKQANVPSPARWWPGSNYVTWVGIDGYYFDSSSTFAPLFGPTVAAVRALASKPILIAETGAAPAAGQPAKIADLFAGTRLFGLLGFVWFDAVHAQDWRLTSPAAFAAFRRGAKTYHRPGS